ncbi:MAG TPA: tetratricopeptide repeat protein [Candidatus Cybelea sp.]|nr:tetratricopeptide repeat protein [Candidatus Cybelea sp.]
MAVAALAPPLAARAQNVSRPETQVPGQIQQEIGGVARGSTAAAQGGQAGELESLTVDFGDVLKNPDDVGLNFRLALTRIREGRLELAAAALQRVLLVAPDQAGVRLLYGIVLYRLDDLVEAEAELNRVKASNPPPETARIADEYLDRITRARRAFHGAASFSFGPTYDHNRNAFPNSGQALLQGVQLPISGNRASDVGWTGIAGAEMSYDPGRQRLREIFANASLLNISQDRVHSLDTKGAVGEAGVVYHFDEFDARPVLFGQAIDVGHHGYLNEGGIKLGATRRLGPDLQGFAEAKVDRQNYLDSMALPVNHELSGNEFGGTLGASYSFNPTLSVSGSYQPSYFDATTSFNSYWSHMFSLNASYVLPWHSFVLANTSAEFRSYGDPDPFVSSAITRDDHIYNASITYGIPLDTVWPYDTGASFMQGFIVSFTAAYIRNESNVINYDWHSWRAGGLLTKRFEF